MITREMLAEAMNEIDPAIIAEHTKRISPPRAAVKYAVAALIYAAACAVVVLSLPFILGVGNDPSVTPEPPITPGNSVSTTTESDEPMQPDENVITYDSWEEALDGEYIDALLDFSELAEYFHEPYNIGDDISDKKVLDRCVRYILHHSYDYSTLVVDEHETQTVSISEAELDSLCKALFGEHVSIRDYDRFLYAYPSDYTIAADYAEATGEWENGTIGSSARYLKDGVYTFSYATDYWGECKYSVDYDVPPVIRPTETGFSVTVGMLYSRDLGESKSAGEATYTFELTTDCSGKDRYRLLSIDSDIHCTNTVQCTINYAAVDFDWNTCITLNGINIFTMAVDESFIDYNGVWENYTRWDSTEREYVSTIRYINTFIVDENFVMDEAIHPKAYIGGSEPSFEGVEPIMGTNKNGVDYVMYIGYKSEGFISYAYFRVAPDKIVCFAYEDTDEFALEAWCDSVSKIMTEEELPVEKESGFDNVIFGEYGLEVNVSGDMEYVARVQKANYAYLLSKTAPGKVYITPELSAVMEDGEDDTVYAVHIIGFTADATSENLSFATDSQIKRIVDGRGKTFDELGNIIYIGEIFYLTADEINELSCEDIGLVCGLALYTNLYDSTHESDFKNELDRLSGEDNIYVYVYYNAFSDRDLIANEKITDEYEYVNLHHTAVENEAFREYLSDGTIMNGLTALAKMAGVDDDVTYTPSLSRFQASMTAEQIEAILGSCRVVIRRFE